MNQKTYVSLKLRLKSGLIQENFEVEELLEVDGKPYTPVDDIQELREQIIYQAGQIEVLEKAVFQPALTGANDDA